MNVKITVIVPVYNVEKYLKECLDSIVTQRYDNYEVICVNDGSTDGSLKILNEYAARYEKIKVISKVNGGLSSARNCGIENATGDYMYFLDSDDLLADDSVLTDMASYVTEDDLDVLYLDGESFFESKELYDKNYKYEKAYTSEKDYGIYETGIELFSAFAKHRDFRLQACFQCIKKTFVDRYNLRYLNGILYEDNLFFFKSILSAGRVRHIKRVVMKRRVREGSIMQSRVNFNSLRSFLYIYIECEKFLEKQDGKFDKYQEEIRYYLKAYKNRVRNIFYKEMEVIEKGKIEELGIEERKKLENILKEWKYTFPHDLIEENDKIAIYGAGKVGIEYYHQAIESHRYNSVIAVDKKGKEASTSWMDVICPEQLLDIYIDKIIIGIESREVAMDVLDYLQKMGIKKDKIIWDVRQSIEKR